MGHLHRRAYFGPEQPDQAKQPPGRGLNSHLPPEQRESSAADNLELAFARRELGLALSNLARHDEAIAQMELCEQVFRRVGGPKHPDVLELGRVFEAAKRYADAERIDRMAVESLREERRTMRAKLVYALGELARMVEYRSPEKAVPLYDEAMRSAVKLPKRLPQEDIEGLERISKTALAAGQARWALRWFDRFPEAAAKLADVRRQLIKARRRK